AALAYKGLLKADDIGAMLEDEVGDAVHALFPVTGEEVHGLYILRGEEKADGGPQRLGVRGVYSRDDGLGRSAVEHEQARENAEQHGKSRQYRSDGVHARLTPRPRRATRP